MQYFKPVAATATTTIFLIQKVLDMTSTTSYDVGRSGRKPISDGSEFKELLSAIKLKAEKFPTRLHLKFKVCLYEIF